MSLHVVFGLAQQTPNLGYASILNHEDCIYQIPFLHLCIVTRTTSHIHEWLLTLQWCKIYVALLPVLNFFSMEVWNGIWKKTVVWNTEWKIFSMEWQSNGRNLPVWNMEKLSSISFHSMAQSSQLQK